MNSEEKKQPASEGTHKKNTYAAGILCIVTGLAVGIILKLFIIDVLHIKGTSMQPALKDGQTVIVNKLAYGLVKPYSDVLMVQWAAPKPGDIVIYLYNNNIVIKRCIAVEGTPLEYSTDSEYTLLVGANKIPLTDLQYHRMKNNSAVPKEMILAVGDNYAQSIDSRMYGFVPMRNIIGKVICK